MKQSQSAFLVIGQTGIVLQDIMGALAVGFPELQGLPAPTLKTAAAMADGIDVRIAFVTAAPDEFSHSDLAARLDRIGAHIVLMGDGAEEFGAQSPYAVLHRPFNSDDIVNIARLPACARD